MPPDFRERIVARETADQQTQEIADQETSMQMPMVQQTPMQMPLIHCRFMELPHLRV